MSTSKLKFAISEDIKAMFPEEKLASLIQTFNQLDLNQDGKIGLNEYFEFALTKEKARLVKKFESVDTDKDGSVDFDEFVAAAEPYFQILKRFRELDLDHNGLLSLNEALDIADKLILPISKTQVAAIIVEADHDKDGQITYYEYLGAIARIGFQ